MTEVLQKAEEDMNLIIEQEKLTIDEHQSPELTEEELKHLKQQFTPKQEK